MKHHQCFLVYSKSTRAKRITDTLFFNHTYLTSPSVTPADSVVKAVQQMRDTLSGISKGESYKMQELRSLTKLYEEIAAKYKAVKEGKEIRDNGIKTYPEEEIPLVDRHKQRPNQT